MNKKKLAMSLTSLALVGAVAVGGTLAYLSSTSNWVNNTFSVGTGYIPDDKGHVGLWLDEKDIVKSTPNNEVRTEKGNNYEDMMPGSVVEKDPTFHMTKGSTSSYVIARVVHLDDAMANGYSVISEVYGEKFPGEINPSWQKVANIDGTTENLDATKDGYYAYVNWENYSNIVDATENAVDLPTMFDYVALDGEIEDLTTVHGSVITISGVAVQAENNTLEGALQVAMEKLN